LLTEASKGSNLWSVETSLSIVLTSFSLNIDVEKVAEKVLGGKVGSGEQVEGNS
jgi:hypothetical protein